LIFFIHPSQEGFVIVMEDTSILWPFSVEAASIEESISFFEEEVIINELLSIFCRK
tara:strand:+ start:1501 stop:1668 length:168 start_codon:yes stop_codon:yes gene_type:complete